MSNQRATQLPPLAFALKMFPRNDLQRRGMLRKEEVEEELRISVNGWRESDTQRSPCLTSLSRNVESFIPKAVAAADLVAAGGLQSTIEQFPLRLADRLVKAAAGRRPPAGPLLPLGRSSSLRDSAGADQVGPFQDVEQLADVPRPVVTLEDRQSRGLEFCGGSPRRSVLQEVLVPRAGCLRGARAAAEC